MIAAALTLFLFPIGARPAAPVAGAAAGFTDARFGRVWISATTDTSGEPSVVLWLDGGAADHVIPHPGESVTTIRVSAREYVARSAPHKGHCFYPASDLEALAQDVEKRIGWSGYVHPVLGGDGLGATLAFQALESAPEGTFAGAISAGFSPRIAVPSNFCAGDGPRASYDEKSRTATLLPAKRLSAPWRLVQGSDDRIFKPEDARHFVAETLDAALVELVREGHPVTAADSWRDAVHAALEEIRSPLPAPTPVASPSPEAVAKPESRDLRDLAGLRDLRLHDVRPPRDLPPDDRVQILLTGDGGWAGIDRGIAAGFAGEGMRTIGWDSLAFFWKKKTPDDIADALARIIESLPADARVVATGFSFGADVISFAVNRLSADDRKRIAAVVLIAPSKEATFEIHPLDWLVDRKHGSDLPTLPELEKLSGLPVICLVPRDDKHSPCRAETLFTVVEGKAGHHLGGDYKAVARSILAPLDRLLPPRASAAPQTFVPSTVPSAMPNASPNGSPSASPAGSASPGATGAATTPLLSTSSGAAAGSQKGSALAHDLIAPAHRW